MPDKKRSDRNSIAFIFRWTSGFQTLLPVDCQINPLALRVQHYQIAVNRWCAKAAQLFLISANSSLLTTSLFCSSVPVCIAANGVFTGSVACFDSVFVIWTNSWMSYALARNCNASFTEILKSLATKSSTLPRDLQPKQKRCFLTN